MRNYESVGQPSIYLITDGAATAENFAEKKSQIFKLVKTAVQSEVSLIQIREKQLSARLVYELTSETVKSTRHTAAKLLVNDRADIALAAKADGVHLTSRSLSADIIRKNFPKDFIVGASAHTIKEAEIAKRQGADFITFSPIFQSPNKGEPRGIEELREVCQALKPFPVIALGGIDEMNWREVLQAGASGFAAIRFLSNEMNLRNLAHDFRR